jgi:hypothetical protein
MPYACLPLLRHLYLCAINRSPLKEEGLVLGEHAACRTRRACRCFPASSRSAGYYGEFITSTRSERQW